MSAVPRLLLGSLYLAAPLFLVLIVLVETGTLASAPAAAAALVGYALTAAIYRPLLSGILAVEAAIRAMAADDNAMPEVTTTSPLVRDLWITLARWAEAERRARGPDRRYSDHGGYRERLC